MSNSKGTSYLTIADAARRTRRTTRTIETWIADGDVKVIWFHGKRYLEVSALLEVLRAKLKNNPNRKQQEEP